MYVAAAAKVARFSISIRSGTLPASNKFHFTFKFIEFFATF